MVYFGNSCFAYGLGSENEIWEVWTVVVAEPVELGVVGGNAVCGAAALDAGDGAKFLHEGSTTPAQTP